MARIFPIFSALALALTLLVFVPKTVFAAVPVDCAWKTSATTDVLLTATVSETCGADPAYTNMDAYLTGPTAVHFYSGSNTDWTKTVKVPVAGTYKLSVTITIQTQAGPQTGTSTCCSVVIYDAAPTPTPAPTAAPTAVPTKAPTPPPASHTTPAPARTPKTPPAVGSTATPVVSASPIATDSPTPSDSPSAAPSDSPSATPSDSAAPAVTPANVSPAGPVSPVEGSGDGTALAIVIGAAVLIGLAALFALFLIRRRKSAAKTGLES